MRVLVSPEGSWWAAKDIYEAHGRPTDRAALAHFAPEHLKLANFTSEEGPVLLTAISPLGVATIAERLPFPQRRILDGFARKTSRAFAEEFGSPPLEMVFLANGKPPVKPRDNSYLEDDWYTLTFGRPHGFRREPNFHEPALADEDPALPPYDPEAALAQSLRRRTVTLPGF